MPIEESDKTNYSLADIDRYLNGQMPSAERNALERAALEDPFLEEALEGYGTLPAEDRRTGVDSVHTLLAERVQSPAREQFRWLPLGWTAAAALLVLAAVGILIYVRKSPVPASVPMAVRTEKREFPFKVTDSSLVVLAPHQEEQREAPSSKSIHPHRAPQREFDTALVSKVMTPATRSADSVTSMNDVAITGKVLYSQSSPATAMPSLQANSSRKPAYHVNNRVLDWNHQPIPEATIQLLPSGKAVQTDANGYFDISSGDTVSGVSLTATGFQPRIVGIDQLKSLSSVELLEQDTSTANVVIIGAAEGKRSELANGLISGIPEDSSNAEPINGWSSFNAYANQHVQLPSEVLLGYIHGDVTVAFQVGPGGKPERISVQTSLCKACDAEAVRLLQQGPAWKKPTTGKANKGTLRIRF